jgi:hypothetical protein
MPDVQLTQREARLVFLATLYHLGRPGSEVDPVTRQPLALGVTPVSEALAAYLEEPRAAAAVTLALSDHQLGRVGEALLGLVNELKQVDLSGRSVVAGLFEALTRVFPDEVRAAGSNSVIDLAGEATMLRRRLAGAIREAGSSTEPGRTAAEAAGETARPWWKVWGR